MLVHNFRRSLFFIAGALLASGAHGCGSGAAFEAAPGPAKEAGAESGGQDAAIETPDVNTEALDANSGDLDAQAEDRDAKTEDLDGNPDAVDGNTEDLDGNTDAVDGNTEDLDGSTDAVDGNTDAGAETEPGSPEAAPEAAHDAVEASNEACEAATWYRDQDGDGFGESLEKVSACEAPVGYVALAGDCRDDLSEVHPGQLTFFDKGYLEPNSPQGVSFDYDCNGVENAEPGVQAAPHCTGLLICQGSGFEPMSPARTGPGINGYCGSNKVSTCTLQGLACGANTVASTNHYRCR